MVFNPLSWHKIVCKSFPESKLGGNNLNFAHRLRMDQLEISFNCDSMNYLSVRYVGQFLGDKYGSGTGQIWLDDVACSGTETHLFNCNHTGWGFHNCGHKEDVSISCGSSIYGKASIMFSVS